MKIKRKELEERLSEQFKAGFDRGFFCGLCTSFYDSMQRNTVTDIVFNGNKTILKFQDGSHEVVTYDPSYGYPYDKEKAVVICLLKHVSGNYYLNMMRYFGISSGMDVDMGSDEGYPADEDMQYHCPAPEDDGISDMIDQMPDEIDLNSEDYHVEQYDDTVDSAEYDIDDVPAFEDLDGHIEQSDQSDQEIDLVTCDIAEFQWPETEAYHVDIDETEDDSETVTDDDDVVTDDDQDYHAPEEDEIPLGDNEDDDSGQSEDQEYHVEN